MNARYLTLVLTMVFAIGLSATANADTLATNSSALASGSASISQSTTPKFFAHVDYAVYSPGDYPGSLTFPADKYVYCYQLFNDSTSTSNITSLNIGIDPLASVSNTNYDSAPLSGMTGGVNPASYGYSNNQVQYVFTSRNSIAVNQHSSVLIFTSDLAPDSIMGTGLLGTVNAGSFKVAIPVPIPEPASVFILALGTPALLAIRRRK